MPKSRKAVKVDGHIVRSNVATKFLIGTRKNGVAANLMSNDALNSALEDKNKTKFHPKILKVLANRK